ncbi:putative TrkA-N domain containing protein [Trypanosoma cruzi]|nr:putative TrkA-N domain containing protein [Trypanosoma cruzi]
MQEKTQHLLDGVVGLTCVDPSLDLSVCAAPFVVSIIAQQCLYLCHAASSCQALLNEGGSSFWHIMRLVTEARARYAALRAPPSPRPLFRRRAASRSRGHTPSFVAFRSNSPSASSRRGCISSGRCGGNSKTENTSSNHRTNNYDAPCSSAGLGTFFHEHLMLSPLEFRVVVVGGGRVGRAVVERLLQASYLIHPSRITIITRQTETVAHFAGRGVQCTERRDGRQALLECHVLIVACQQTQFNDFATTYCPRHTQNTAGSTAKAGNNSEKQEDISCEKKRLCRSKKRTLRDVVDKWRTIEDDDYANGAPGAAMTRLLKPGTFVFSCCAALETHKIAKELGHLDPLVVNADIDMDTIQSAARQFQSGKDNFRSAFVQSVAVEGNSFLNALNVLQQTYLDGKTPPADLINRNIFYDSYFSRLRMRKRRPLSPPPPPSVGTALRAEGVSGSTSFLLRVWRALRCFVIVQVSLLKASEHRPFTYLQQVGPLLGPILVALPFFSQNRIVNFLGDLLNKKKGDDDDDEESALEGRPLFKLNHRVVAACDSDSDSDECHDVPPAEKELTRLIKNFPLIFENEEVVLQQLREQYIAVTER